MNLLTPGRRCDEGPGDRPELEDSASSPCASSPRCCRTVPVRVAPSPRLCVGLEDKVPTEDRGVGGFLGALRTVCPGASPGPGRGSLPGVSRTARGRPRSTGVLRHAGACLSHYRTDHTQSLYFTICDALGKLLTPSGPVLGVRSKDKCPFTELRIQREEYKVLALSLTSGVTSVCRVPFYGLRI